MKERREHDPRLLAIPSATEMYAAIATLHDLWGMAVDTSAYQQNRKETKEKWGRLLGVLQRYLEASHAIQKQRRE